MPYLLSCCRANARRGKVVLLVAVSLVPVLGFTAIAVDGGMLLDNRRRVQAAADAAALAAATDLFENYQLNEGLDRSGSAANCARATATLHDYPPNGPRSNVTVFIPPQSGDHVGKPGYAEVLVDYRQPRFFSTIFRINETTVRGRAVARGRWAEYRNGIIVLDLNQSEALKANGNGSVVVRNADIIVNSSNATAVASDGNGSVIRVENGSFYLSGGVKSNTILQGPIEYQQRPIPDPLFYIPEPSLPGTANRVSRVSPSSSEAKPYLNALNLVPKDVTQMYILEPGRYDTLPNFGNGDVVIFKQASANAAGGVYYLNGSGLTSTGATMVMDPTGETTGGLMFFNDPTKTSQGITINGGRVKLAPPTSGIYSGIMFFQRRTADVPLQIAGQGGMEISGTFYVVGGQIKITGSSTSQMDVIGSQYISRTLQSGGNGSYVVDWTPQQTARIRLIGLVE